MTDIARLRDADGKLHFTSRDSKFARDGLAKGSLVDIDKEVVDATPDAQNGDDLNAGTVDSGPGKRQRKARTSDDGDGSGVVEPTPGS